MRLRILGLVLAVLALSVTGSALTPSTGAAQASAAAQATAKEAFKRGQAAYNAGNYDVAVREWQAAYASDPRPLIQFNLSQAFERMGQLPDAIDSLKRYLESAPADDYAYSDANARYVALQQRVAATGVVVQGGNEGGSILVDDQDWGRTPRPDKIGVTPGNHVIVVRWADGREYRTSAYVPAGQVVTISVGDAGAPVAQVPAPAAVAAASVPQSAPAAPPEGRSKTKKIVLYSVGGAVAAIGVGLLVYGGVRGGATSKCGELKDGIETYCDPDSKRSAEHQSIGGYVAGGVLLAGGAAIVLVNALTGRHDDTRRASQCGVGFTSASCTFRF